ncbi:MAG: transglycosylase domain-containing protein [Adhaeribacter sp.]
MKIAKRILLVIGLLLAAIVIYYTVVVLNARAKTPAIVQGVLNSGRMKLELHDLTNEQMQALLKVQDQNFYNHQGFDISTPGTGITTISQGLVKFYYFDKFKPGIQKIKQTLIARFAFDPMTPKDTILKLFINEVYLGQHNGKEVKGFENAANAYLNKSFKELTWDEYLGLVAMIRSPNNLHYIKDKEVNQERVARIKKVLAGEYIPVDNSDWLYGQKVKL